MYYIVIITSTDYYTFYDGFEIVKADSPEDASKKAQRLQEKKGHTGFGSYRQVENVIQCGNTRPKEK